MSGLRFRLPTEAQWEYACRAGTRTPFSFGENITTDQVNYNGNLPYNGGANGVFRRKTVDVKSLPCNAWGLYQMHGNVQEWCQDWYGNYPSETVTDPEGPGSGTHRLLAWRLVFPRRQGRRCAYRVGGKPGYRVFNTGFRFSPGQAG